MDTVTLNGWAFLAQSSKRIACTLLVSDHDAVLTDESGQEVLRLPRSSLRFETALGNAARRATLPDGTLFETNDHDQVARLGGANTGAALSAAERFHPRLFLFVLAAIGAVFLVWRFALPALVWVAVALTPEPLRDAIDAGSLQAFDLAVAEPTTLSTDRQEEVRVLFDRLIAELPEKARNRDFVLEFRSIPGIGPNAAALPGGTVIITDALVKRFPNENIIASVLGHELGHVVEDHGLTQLYRSVGFFVLVTLIAGDTGPILEDILLEGGVILSLSFSREHERSADQFGLRLTQKAGYDPAGLIGFFEALPGAGSTDDGWFSTHPSSGSRIEAIEEFLENR